MKHTLARILHGFLRVLRVVAASLGVLLLFIVSVVAGALLNLDRPTARRFAVKELNGLLDPQFKGKIVVTRLGHLSIFGVSGVDAEVTAADGTRVITGRGVAARISPLAILKSALFGKGDLEIGVDKLTIDAVEANVDTEEDGSLKLVGAFDPQKPSPPPKPGARGTAIDLGDIRLTHAWVHGVMAGAPPIDADVDQMKAAFLSATNLTKLDVPGLTLTARGLPMGVHVKTGVTAHLEMPAPSGESMLVRGALDGAVGEIPLTAKVNMDGDALDAVLDVPEVDSDAVRASVLDAPVYRKVSAHAEAHGELANLKASLHANLGDGKVDLDALVHAKGSLGGNATIVAQHIDARTFSKTGPATDVGARIVANAETATDKSLIAHASVDIPVGTAAGQVVPHTNLQVDAAQRVAAKEGGAPTLTAHVVGIVDEKGAPVALTADARSRGGVSDATFGVYSAVPSLAAVERLHDVGEGKIAVTLSGRAHVAKEVSFEAQVDVDGQQIRAGGARVDNVRVLAQASGTPASPVVDARVLARGVNASGYAFSRAEVEAAGTPSKLRVAVSANGEKTPDVSLQTDVTLAPALALNETSLGLRRGSQALRVLVESVRVEKGGVLATGIVVSGAGEPLYASFHSGPGSLVVKAKSDGLDVGKAAYLAGQADKYRGDLKVDVELDARRDYAKGKVNLDLTKGTMPNVKDGEAHVNLTLDGRHLQGGLRAFVGEAGSFEVKDVDVHVAGGGALDVRSWKHAWGKLGIAANVDLAKVARLLPPDSLNVTDIAGRVVMTGSVQRDSLEDTTPEVHLSIVTDGLTATGQSTKPLREPGGPLMVGPPTWQLYGMDLRSDLVIDGADSAGELSMRVVDKEGGLVALDVKTAPLPFADLFSGEGDLTSKLEALPISVRVDMPQRELSKLPLLIRPDGVKGGAALSLTMTGTALEPKVDLDLKANGIRVAEAPETPMDGLVAVRYDGAVAKVNADLKSKDAPLLHAEVLANAKAKDFIASNGTTPSWGGSVKANLTKFPLGAISALSEDQVKGFVSGDLAVTGLHENGKAVANLTFDDLKVGKAKFTKGNVGVTLDDNGLDAKVRLEDASGFLDASAKMGMKWGAEIAPSPDGKGLEAKVTAKHFNAAAAAPFASSAVSELSGWLDADASVRMVPGQKPEMSGSLAFSDGIVQAPAIGEEFHGVKAKVSLSKEGAVKISDVEAHGLSGRLTASGDAQLDGMSLRDANLALDIKKKEAIPLDIQGTNLGTVYGGVKVKATSSADGKSMKVAVNIPEFHVNLPEAGFPRSPQGLADAPGVHMGVYRDPDRFIVLPVDNAPVKLVAERNATIAALPKQGGVPAAKEPTAGEAQAAKDAQDKKAPSTEIDATVHIGNIEVLRGTQVDVNLGGDLNAKVASTTTVRGQIVLKDGRLEVQSKEFEVEKGTISFVGDDPSNPEVSVTAGWTAPDGTRVLADYIGPVKTGKVALRSEPPRPKNEIVALILFGTADGSSATPYASKSPSTGTQAGTAVGGLATDGLSKGLDQLTGMNVTAKIDTSDSANPRPEVEVQIAKDLSLELAVVLGTPPPGTNPDTTYATIDWRFVRNWSLDTTFGDQGSTFADMVWQYRY